MQDCIFCKIVRGEAPSWKVEEDELTYTFLDINPVSRYHTLVIPKRHCTNMFDVTEEDAQAVIATVRRVVRRYREQLGIENVQVLSSNGAEAQQDVFHLHYHIIPRRRGDGQQIRWNTYPEWRSEFDAMLAALR
jgi:histidine triad (HIT) family protein